LAPSAALQRLVLPALRLLSALLLHPAVSLQGTALDSALAALWFHSHLSTKRRKARSGLFYNKKH
jgi:hypothetical protein